MTFLAPMAGVIAAALTVPALVALYLLKLRRKQLRVSSTLLWANAVQDLQVNTPFRWLRFSLLFLIHLLALLLLVLAVARPALTDPDSGGTRVIIVLDRSASMGATDGVAASGATPTTRLDEAKRRAEEIITALGRRGGGFGLSAGRAAEWTACVVGYAGRAEALTAFTSDAGVLRDAVRAVTVTDQPADAAALMRLLDALGGGGASEDDEAAAPRHTRIHVVSDGDFASSDPGQLPQLARGVDIELNRVGPQDAGPDTGAPDRDNLGIVSISARRDHEDPGRVRLFARLANASRNPIETMVQVRLEGELVDARSVAVPAASVGPDGGGGEAAVTFELENTTGGVVVVTIARSDLLAADDSAALVLAPSGRARVLVVAPGEYGAEADTYLTSALEAMDLRNWRAVGAPEYAAMMRFAARLRTEGENAPLGDSSIPDPRDWDLVIFDRVRPDALPTLPSVSFGAGLPLPGVGVRSLEQGAARMVSWQRTHPVLRYVNLDQVIVGPSSILTMPGAGDDGERGVLAWSEDGPVIGVLGDAASSAGGLRRVLVGFPLASSNWGPDFSFPVFLSNVLDYVSLRGDASAGRAVRTTDAVQIRGASGDVLLEGPVSRRALATEDGVATFGQVEMGGVYRVTSPGLAGGGEWLAVNLCDVGETLLRTGWQLPGGVSSVDAVASGGERATDRAEREIWHWFVLGALAFLTLEWFVQAWKMRG